MVKAIDLSTVAQAVFTNCESAVLQRNRSFMNSASFGKMGLDLRVGFS